MADNLLRLRVDSQEYDSKIKRASEGLQRYIEGCKKAGGTLEYLDEGVMDFVKSLGTMETEAKSAREKLTELSNAFTDLSMTYHEMSEEAKNTDVGRELSNQIQILGERARDAKTQIELTRQSINGFSAVNQGVSALTSAFQSATGAAKLLGVDVGNDVEVIAKLQSAAAVANGIRELANMLKLASQAQFAFNTAAKANPYVLIASAVTAAGVALLAFTKRTKESTEATKEQEEALKQAQRMAEIWKSSLSNTYSSLMTKYDELRRQWVSLKNEHQKIEWIKQNESALQNLGLAVNDVKSAEETFNNNTDAVVQSFVRRAQAAARVAQLTELYRKQIELLDEKEKINSAYQSVNQDNIKNGPKDTLTDSTLGGAIAGALKAQIDVIDTKIEANQAEINKVKDQIGNEASDFVGPKGGDNKQYKPGGEPLPVEIINDKRTGVGFNPESSAFGENGGMKSIKDLQADLRYFKDLLANAKTQEEYKTATSGIAQTQGAIKAQSLALELDVSIAEAEVMSQAQSLRDSLETYFKDNPLKFNVDGGLAKEGKDARDSWKSAASAVQSVGSAIASIEDPAAKVAGTVAQAIATVALAYADTLAKDGASKSNIFAFIAAAAAATVSMATTIASIHSATGYEQGGIVGGNSYSNDQVPIMANSGELVLTRAMQGNLASQLQGNNSGGVTSNPYVTGDKIVLGINNWGKKTGRGELVFSRN